MNPVRDIALVDELRALPAETAWVEFKGNNTDPDMIGERCSALSNAARIEGRDVAYIRIGSATPKLTDDPERYQQLMERMQPYRWEQGIARQYASGDDVLPDHKSNCFLIG